MDAGVILGDNADIVLDNTLAEIFPSLVGLLVCRLTLLGIKDIGVAEVGTKYSRDLRPSHKLVDGEQLQELGVEGYLRVAGIFVDSVEEVRLLIIVRGQDYIVDDSLKNLRN